MSRNICLFVFCKNNPGGAERRFFYLFEQIVKSNDRVYLFTNKSLLEKIGLPEYAMNNIVTIDTDFLRGRLASFVFACYSAIRFIVKLRIYHIHFCVNPSPYSLIIGLFSKLTFRTYSISIVNSHIKNIKQLGRLGFLKWKVSMYFSDWIDVLSPSISQNVRTIFSELSLEKMSISPCSFSKFAELRFMSADTTNALPLEFDFCFASRLIEGKGLNLLMRTVNDIELKGVGYKFVIVGDGELFESLSDWANTLVFNKVLMVGYKRNIHDYILKSRCVLSLQEHENYPSQLIYESMALRRTVIATDVGDTRIILNEENSILVQSNISSLQEAFTKISGMTNSQLSSFTESAFENVINVHNVKNYKKYFLDKLSRVFDA